MTEQDPARSPQEIERLATARRICGCWACAYGPMDAPCSVRDRAVVAIAEEREACAKLDDERHADLHARGEFDYGTCCQVGTATAIRART